MARSAQSDLVIRVMKHRDKWERSMTGRAIVAFNNIWKALKVMRKSRGRQPQLDEMKKPKIDGSSQQNETLIAS